MDFDRSARWTVSAVTLEHRHVSALLFEPTRGGVFAGTHGEGLFFSGDRGESWHPVAHELARANVFSLACSVRGDAVTLLAGTEPVMLYGSVDYGRTWQARSAIAEMDGREKWTFPAPPHIAHLKSIAIHPAEPDVYYACIEQGALLKTTDAGRTWRELSAYFRPDDRWYRDIHKLVPTPGDPRKLFMSSGMGVYRSADGGESWDKLTGDDFAIGYPDHLIVSPRDEQTVFVAGAATPPNVWRQTHAAKSVVMCSRDGGRSWRAAAGGLPVNGRAAIEAMSVAAGRDAYELFLANTDGEVYRSADEGASWDRIAAGLAPVSKAMHSKYVT
ncbi:MAG TPA: glycosyl hydrolase [Casimicrobiaceae bacterium]|nr:glycosyl hydrolase [Casimicrobiaceae bacterium]